MNIMSELIAVGIRIDQSLLSDLNEIAKSEHLDRTTIIRKILFKAVNEYKVQQAMERYKKGVVSISRAAVEANMTVFEFVKYLIDHDYKSKYSIEDLERELILFEKTR
jgi:metal-responsive CopG/Arc/MetJ family transcriptional regulator